MTDAVIVPSMQKALLKRKPWAPPRQCDTGEAARRGGRLCPPAEYSAFFGNLRRIRNILRADKSRRPLQKTEVPRSAAPCSVEAVSDESPADSLDCADTGADPSGDQHGCKKLHSDAPLLFPAAQPLHHLRHRVRQLRKPAQAAALPVCAILVSLL